MGNDVVISAEGLGKKYLIGHVAGQESYRALRDVVAQTARGLVRSASDLVHGRQIIVGDSVEEFWALRDVNFEIKRGEVVGIIGRNGAGKSTLLKILSRITEPSEGRVTLKGRVASLLEVGTGFHPELTGRENIYLNGAILGMTRVEINRKFDEIVAFAAITNFLDTPVKRYSSGMYVRLAFAVAAHLEPEILIVDEVLAVGDAEFQAKCLGKLGEVSSSGRTVIFVSHDLRSIHSLCSKGILLREGMVAKCGTVQSVIEKYSSGIEYNKIINDLSKCKDRTGSGEARFVEVELVKNLSINTIIQVGDALYLNIKLKIEREFGEFVVAATINSSDGIPLICLMSNDESTNWCGTLGCHRISLELERLLLYPGVYTIDLWLGDLNLHRVDHVKDALSIKIEQGNNMELKRSLDTANGFFYQKALWKSNFIDKIKD